MNYLFIYRQARRENRHIIAETLPNGVVVVISPEGTMNNLASMEQAQNFIDKHTEASE